MIQGLPSAGRIRAEASSLSCSASPALRGPGQLHDFSCSKVSIWELNSFTNCPTSSGFLAPRPSAIRQRQRDRQISAAIANKSRPAGCASGSRHGRRGQREPKPRYPIAPRHQHSAIVIVLIHQAHRVARVAAPGPPYPGRQANGLTTANPKSAGAPESAPGSEPQNQRAGHQKRQGEPAQPQPQSQRQTQLARPAP